MQCAGKETADDNPDLGLMFQCGVEKYYGTWGKRMFAGFESAVEYNHCMNCSSVCIAARYISFLTVELIL
jgi:hypothetical protein